MAAALAPLTVACPHCNARRGLFCTSVGAHTTTLHAARKRLLADLSEDERIAAYETLRAERAGTRAATVALLGGAA